MLTEFQIAEAEYVALSETARGSMYQGPHEYRSFVMNIQYSQNALASTENPVHHLSTK